MENYIENPNKKVYNIDFDGTLTNGVYVDFPKPNIDIILKVQKLYVKGHIIIIWTARQWNMASKLVSWLTKYEVPFHGIYMAKGGSDVYVDDKSILLDKFLEL